MDPDANHARQVELALKIIRALDEDGGVGPEEFVRPDRVDVRDDANELAELVIALNDWVANGGFPPAKFGASR